MQSSYGEELGVGEKIAGRYEVLSVLGKGSMGVVYKARHDILGRIVAIKTLRLQRIVDDRSAKRFEREAKVACLVEHQNTVKVFDFGYTGDGIPYLVMDYVSGIPLYNILKEERHITPDRAVVLFSQVCDGLYHAHQRGVIHRDLKPANIMVLKKEHEPESVRIVDLGVAKIVAASDDEAEAITRTGEVCGSPIYLSPEQCVYQELDPRTDIYSLGVCLYECLTGTPPLRGATVYDTIYMHVNEKPKPFKVVAPELDIPPRVEEIVMRCLAKRPCDRFETMLELKQELIAALRGGSAPAINVLSPDQLFARKGKNPEAVKSSGQHPQLESTPSASGGEMPRPGDAVQEPGSPSRDVARAEQASKSDAREVSRGEARQQSSRKPTKDGTAKSSESGRFPKQPTAAKATGTVKKAKPGLADTISKRIIHADPVWQMAGAAGILFGIGALIYAGYITQQVESKLREQTASKNDGASNMAARSNHPAGKPPKTAVKPRKGGKDESAKNKIANKTDEPKPVKPIKEEPPKSAKTPAKDDAKLAAKPKDKEEPARKPKKGLLDGTEDMALAGLEMMKPGKTAQEPKKAAETQGEQAPPAMSILPDLFKQKKPEKKPDVKPEKNETKIASLPPAKKTSLMAMEAKLDTRPAPPTEGTTPEVGSTSAPPPPQPQISAQSRDIELAETFYRTGREEFNAKNFPAAIKAFEGAYARHPVENYKLALAAALTEGALSCSRNHQYDIAVTYQSRACELFPNNEKYQRNLSGYKSNRQMSGSY